MEIVVALVLAALLLTLAGAMLWQERRHVPDVATIYSVEESIEYVRRHLDPQTKDGLLVADLRRILEWAVRYLQDPTAWEGDAPVVGSTEMAQFVQNEAFAAGYAYDGSVIIAILDRQAEYLGSIGAIGGAVDGDGPAQTP